MNEKQTRIALQLLDTLHQYLPFDRRYPAQTQDIRNSVMKKCFDFAGEICKEIEKGKKSFPEIIN